MLDTLLEKKTLDQHKLKYAIFLKLAFNSYRGEKCFNAVLQCAIVFTQILPIASLQQLAVAYASTIRMRFIGYQT